jgi:hypothetical protein
MYNPYYSAEDRELIIEGMMDFLAYSRDGKVKRGDAL